jgi:hypothetical protein
MSEDGGESLSGTYPVVELGHIEHIYEQRIGRLEAKLAELVAEVSVDWVHVQHLNPFLQPHSYGTCRTPSSKTS